MQALAFRAGSFQFDCVAEAEQRPRQSELVGGSIKKPRRLAEQCAFCGEVSDTVSQGMDGPAGTDVSPSARRIATLSSAIPRARFDSPWVTANWAAANSALALVASGTRYAVRKQHSQALTAFE